MLRFPLLNLVSASSDPLSASAMNRLLRCSRSADFDSPAPDSRPLIATPVARAPYATAWGKGVIAEPAFSSSTTHARGIQIPGPTAVPRAAPSQAPATVLRTASSKLVPRLDLGAPGNAVIPCLDAGPSTTNGLHHASLPAHARAQGG